MNRSTLASLSTLGLMALAFVLYFIPRLPEAFATTTITITGWNVPSGTTFQHGLIVLILPMATMALFAGLPLMVEQRGPIVVTMGLIGLTIGSVIGMMSLTATGPTDISFGFVVVSSLFLILWLWKGGS
jgi:hypothetical protein